MRRVANPLGVGRAGETHFLFGDDRFAVGRRVRAGGRPARPAAAGPGHGRRRCARLDRRDAARRSGCATRSPTSSSSPGRRCGSAPGTSTARRSPAAEAGAARPEMELRPEPLPDAGRLGRRGRPRGDAVRDARQPLPHRAGRRRADRAAVAPQVRAQSDAAAALETRLSRRLRAGLGSARRAPSALATARAAAALLSRAAGQPDRVKLVEALATTGDPAHDAAVARVAARPRPRSRQRWPATAGTGSRRCSTRRPSDTEAAQRRCASLRDGAAQRRDRDRRCGRRSCVRGRGLRVAERSAVPVPADPGPDADVGPWRRAGSPPRDGRRPPTQRPRRAAELPGRAPGRDRASSSGGSRSDRSRDQRGDPARRPGAARRGAGARTTPSGRARHPRQARVDRAPSVRAPGHAGHGRAVRVERSPSARRCSSGATTGGSSCSPTATTPTSAPASAATSCGTGCAPPTRGPPCRPASPPPASIPR